MSNLCLWLDSLKTHGKPLFEECLSYLGDSFPLLNKFEQTEQDSEWHGEGNVAIHTNMVLQELYVLLDTQASYLNGEQRQILILSALLHDIAKPITTRRRDINGVERVVAPKHELIGANYLALRLIKLPVSYQVVSTVLGLVAFHNMPKMLIVRKQLEFSDFFSLACKADLALLYWLEVADMRGRECADFDLQMELLHQYRLFVEDYALWHVEQPQLPLLAQIQAFTDESRQTFLECYAINQLATGSVCTVQEAIAKNFESCQRYSHFYITCGISGSGKTTWVENNLPDFEKISLDDMRAKINGKRESQKRRGQVLQHAKKALKCALANKQNVVWDATNLRSDFREALCLIGKQYGALTTLVVFQIEEKQIRHNNQCRAYAVSDDVISKQIKHFEWPWKTEAHRTIVVGNSGETISSYGSF